MLGKFEVCDRATNSAVRKANNSQRLSVGTARACGTTDASTHSCELDVLAGVVGNPDERWARMSPRQKCCTQKHARFAIAIARLPHAILTIARRVGAKRNASAPDHGIGCSKRKRLVSTEALIKWRAIRKFCGLGMKSVWQSFAHLREPSRRARWPQQRRRTSAFRGKRA